MIFFMYRKFERVSLRLLVWILLFSSFFAVCVTLVQLYTDYKSSRSTLESHLEQMANISSPPIATSVWNYNSEVMKDILEGLLTQKEIALVQVMDKENNVILQLGSSAGLRDVVQKVPLYYKESPTETVLVGHFVISATLTGIYKQLVSKAIVILISQLIKTLLMSICILFIIDFIIIKNLNKLSDWASQVKYDDFNKPLELSKRRKSEHDALDRVVEAINLMQSRFSKTISDKYRVEMELREENEQLKKELIESSSQLDACLEKLSKSKDQDS
ncbi:hypothetical protein [Dongshaea marina]|uniref:hypothetical protein n=1 Tax=Dongshaea marina TaxID=2047966 RepID=UPI000D3E2B72|nr:hypothetical protein [Dongshaea marina]